MIHCNRDYQPKKKLRRFKYKESHNNAWNQLNELNQNNIGDLPKIYDNYLRIRNLEEAH